MMNVYNIICYYQSNETHTLCGAPVKWHLS